MSSLMVLPASNKSTEEESVTDNKLEEMNLFDRLCFELGKNFVREGDDARMIYLRSMSYQLDQLRFL
ncbi:MAG: hypothetical protein ABGY96_28645 [bacterium]|nr:hypothetical protein [Gammaproteobacteria bacterium]HIL96640.1 hypothetical protein [Pseudomonadales bacterium]